MFTRSTSIRLASAVTLVVLALLLVPGAMASSLAEETSLVSQGGAAGSTASADPLLEDVKEQAGTTKNGVTATVADTETGVEPVDATVHQTSDFAGQAAGGATGETVPGDGGALDLGAPARYVKSHPAGSAVVATAAAGAGAWLFAQNAVGLAFGRFLGAPLFSRLAKDDLLENPGRQLLAELVEENPGIGLKELADQANLGWGNTVYHLGRLEAAGLLVSMKRGQARHFFKNGHPAAKAKDAIAVLKNDTAADVGRFLLSTPGATQSSIGKSLGLGAPTVTKYVKRLESEGMVDVLKDGRSKIVQPTAALVDAMSHVDAPVVAALKRQTAVEGSLVEHLRSHGTSGAPVPAVA